MSLLRRKKREPEPAPADDHAVITHLPLSDGHFGTAEERDAIHELEHRIEVAVAALGGDLFGGGEAVLYTYGPDADGLFEAVQACLDGFGLREGAYAVKRYGPADDPNARQERVVLS